MSEMTTNEDAREFGTYEVHGGWRLGLLVARNCYKGNRGHKTDRVLGAKHKGKVEIAEFASMATELVGAPVSRQRVAHYFDGWEAASAAGWVPHADSLVPGQEVSLPAALKWEKFYLPITGGRPRDTRPIDAVTIIERRTVPVVVKSMPEPMRRELLVTLTQWFDAEREQRLASDEAPIRNDDHRLDAGRIIMSVAKADRDLRVALTDMQSAGIELDTDDRDRLHAFVSRMREALDLLDTLAGGGVDDAALEAWLAGGAA